MAAELTGTPTAISWGTSATPSPQNISIPADCTAVYAFAGGYGGGNLDNQPTFTLAGASPNQSVGKGGNPGTLTSGKCSVWYNPPTGTQSLTIVWDQAQSFGPCCIVAYVRGGDTTAWRDADAANAESANAVSVTLTTVAGDLVLKFDQQVEGGGELLPPLSAGWINGQTQSGQASDSARLSYISASGTTQVCNCEEESYSLVLAVAIPAAAAAATSLLPGSGTRNLLTGRLPHLRMSEHVARERRLRSGDDAAEVVRASRRAHRKGVAFSFLGA